MSDIFEFLLLMNEDDKVPVTNRFGVDSPLMILLHLDTLVKVNSKGDMNN